MFTKVWSTYVSKEGHRSGHNHALQLNMTPDPGTRTLSQLPPSSGQDKLSRDLGCTGRDCSISSKFYPVAAFKIVGMARRVVVNLPLGERSRHVRT